PLVPYTTLFRSHRVPPRILCVLRGNAFSFLPQLGDDPERLLAARHALAIVEGVTPALWVIVPGRAGRMRAEDRVLQAEQLVVGLRRLFAHDVEPGAHDLLVPQRLVERLLLDNRAAAGVDQDRGRFHQRQLTLPDQ